MLQKSSADKFLLQLKDDLSKLNTDNSKAEKKLSDIMKSLELSVDDEEFGNHLLHFEKIHPRFFEVLQEQNPDLTQNELKLCAYLKLNLSYKDIANILHVQPESVRKAKSRMRRKMGLASDGQVRDYLLAIKTR
ncbi:helix-turn-helix transcriptional regulator [Salinivirga cyanobacteriivorans]